MLSVSFTSPARVAVTRPRRQAYKYNNLRLKRVQSVAWTFLIVKLGLADIPAITPDSVTALPWLILTPFPFYAPARVKCASQWTFCIKLSMSPVCLPTGSPRETAHSRGSWDPKTLQKNIWVLLKKKILKEGYSKCFRAGNLGI